MITNKFYNDALFQGNLKRRKYFENWHFKIVSNDHKLVLAIVPVVVLGKERICYIQILNGLTGNMHYVEYSIDKFSTSKDTMDFWIDKNHFTHKGITLDITTDNCTISGELSFGPFTPFPGSTFSPGILGAYRFLPLRCYHGLISMFNHANGYVKIEDKEFNFNDGSCYIEKDWGVDYPSGWLMFQCHTFSIPDVTFFFLVSTTNVLNKHIRVYMGYLKVKDKFYNLSFYKGVKISQFTYEHNTLNIVLNTKKTKLDITVVPKKHGCLKVPGSASEERYIKESVDATLHINLYEKDKLISRLEGEHTSFDLVPSILKYLEK